MAVEEEADASLPQVWASSISTNKELVPALGDVGLVLQQLYPIIHTTAFVSPLFEVLRVVVWMRSLHPSRVWCTAYTA